MFEPGVLLATAIEQLLGAAKSSLAEHAEAVFHVVQLVVEHAKFCQYIQILWTEL